MRRGSLRTFVSSPHGLILGLGALLLVCSRARALPPPKPSPYKPAALAVSAESPPPSAPLPRSAGVVAPEGSSGPAAAIRALTQVSNEPLVPRVHEVGDPNDAELAPEEPLVPPVLNLDHQDNAPIVPPRGERPKTDEPLVPRELRVDPGDHDRRPKGRR